MKLLEKLIYSLIIFVFVYVILALGLRLFDVTESYTSHMIGGISGTFLGVLVFIYLLIKK
jgi:hypothetical protein